MGKICGIMRIEKRKRTAVYGLQIEANRTYEDHEMGRDFDRSDIDWERTKQNISLIHTDNWGKEITRQLKESSIKEVMRGNNASVVLLDGVYTSSPDWFDEHSTEEAIQFFMDCLAFHVKYYCGGDQSKVINAIIHMDESTPHMQVASIPIVFDGIKARLSAKDIMGTRKDYRHRQDMFYEQVSMKYGMERGEVLEEDKIKVHTTKREWQIATQEERLEIVNQQLSSQEQKMNDNKQQIQQQQKTIKYQQENINLLPHVLDHNEMKEFIRMEKPVNPITGKVSLSAEEYKTLLATKIEGDSLTSEKQKMIDERNKLKRERQHLMQEREEVLEKARADGLQIGRKERAVLEEKGECFDQMVSLIKDDHELSQALMRSLQPRIKQYPQLIRKMSKIFEWAKEWFDNLKLTIRIKM